MEIKTIANVKPTNLNTIKNQIVNTTSSGSGDSIFTFNGYIEDLRKHYACPTKYKLIYVSNNMKIFEELTYGHTVCYSYDVTHDDWYEVAECRYMVHHVDF